MKRHIKHNYTITIGITGADSRTGVTHLSIMLANYLASKEKYKVAVVDLSKGNALKVLQKLYDELNMEDIRGVLLEHSFKVHGVVYYSQTDQRDIANILQLGYDYIIMDFGEMSPDDENYEILRCHKRILVGSCCEWQQEAFMEAIEKRKSSNDQGTWRYAAFLGIQEIRCKLEKLYRIQIHKIPFEEDPFRLSRKHFDSLKNMLQEEAECL